jgi:hypothetical protein
MVVHNQLGQAIGLLAETGLSRQIAATDQGGGAYHSDCMIQGQFQQN